MTKEPRCGAGFFGRGEGIRTPGPMLPKHVRYQTALHPVRVLPTQATLIIIPESGDFVNTFFQKNLKKLKTGFTTWFSGYPTGTGSTGWRGAAPCMPARQAHVRPGAGTANRRPCKARATPGQGSCHRLPKPQHVVLHPPTIHHLWLSGTSFVHPRRGVCNPAKPLLYRPYGALPHIVVTSNFATFTHKILCFVY